MLFDCAFQDIVTKMLHVDPHQRLTAPQVILLFVVKMFYLYVYFSSDKAFHKQNYRIY